MSPSLFDFVRDRGSVSHEEIASELLCLSHLNGNARQHVEKLVSDDPRFRWNEAGRLLAVDPESYPLDHATYVVFDVETTGTSPEKGGITEIGAVKLSGGRVVEEFSTLVNPEIPITSFVVRLTGITNAMVSEAPLVEEVMPRFEEFVEGAVVVGHNVQFDCSFIATARGEPLPNPVLDTLKLARTLVPGLRRYRLSSLAEHFGVQQVPNHRALSDAAATAEIFCKLQKLLHSAGVCSVGEAMSLRGSGGLRVKPQKQHLTDGMPEGPGVYYFVDRQGTVLYVGKANNLRVRTRTYFNGGDGRRKVGRLIEEVAEVRFEEMESELHALIHEAREIKRLLPRYNSVGREPRATWYMRINSNEPYPLPARVSSADGEEGVTYLGPYRSAGVLDTCIEALGRIFPLRQCSGNDDVCFYGQMNRCAPCMGISEDVYCTEVIDQLILLMRGEGGGEHLAALVGERDRLAREQEFEAAARLRDLISGIERLRFTRAIIAAEGMQAVIIPSNAPDLIEVFAFRGGALTAHIACERQDADEISRFARAVLSETEKPIVAASDESRVVAGYLMRRSTKLEVVQFETEQDLLDAVDRFMDSGAQANVASLS